MPHLTLEAQTDDVKRFLLALPAGEETVVEWQGQPLLKLRSVTPGERAEEWSEAKNARRFELIDCELDGSISAADADELERLQAEFRRHRRRIAPLPLAETRELLEELARKAARVPS
jgi:hypothetical protein